MEIICNGRRLDGHSFIAEKGCYWLHKGRLTVQPEIGQTWSDRVAIRSRFGRRGWVDPDLGWVASTVWRVDVDGLLLDL